MQLKMLTKNMEKANKKIATAFKSAHSLHNLKQSSFEVLYALLQAPDNTLTPSKLLEMTHITSGSLTTRVDKLIDKNLVQKNKNQKDKRGRTITLTKEGFDLISSVLEHHHTYLENVFSPLNPKQCEKLNRLLQIWLKE